MSDDGIIYGPKAHEQNQKAVREVTRRMMNEQPQRARWTGGPPANGCSPQYDLRIHWLPTAGSVTVDVTLNDVTDTITLLYDYTAAQAETAINLHSQFVATGVECTCENGPFPESNIVVALPSGATMLRAGKSLSRGTGSPIPEFRVDLCGCNG